jgi:nucleoside 2-deoxyribosyltransferase
VFDDWHAAGPTADDEWKRYEEGRGRTYAEALKGYAARHVFSFDRFHLDRSTCGVLVMPAGRSGHLELGFLAGQGKPTYVLMDNPDRWDVMYQFCSGIHFTLSDLLEAV